MRILVIEDEKKIATPDSPRRGLPHRRDAMKSWPLRTRLAVWTAFFLTVELIFGLASGTLIYNEQLEAFREIRGEPNSPIVIRKEASELMHKHLIERHNQRNMRIWHGICSGRLQPAHSPKQRDLGIVTTESPQFRPLHLCHAS
jgi:hypothetical protein